MTAKLHNSATAHWVGPRQHVFCVGGDGNMNLDGQLKLLIDLRHRAWSKVGLRIPRPLESGLRIVTHDVEPRFEVLECDRRELAKVAMCHENGDYWFDITMYVGARMDY